MAILRRIRLILLAAALGLLYSNRTVVLALPEQCEDICNASVSCDLDCGDYYTMTTCGDYQDGWAEQPDPWCDVTTWDSCEYLCPESGASQNCYYGGSYTTCGSYGAYVSCGDDVCSIDQGEDYNSCPGDCAAPIISMTPTDETDATDNYAPIADDVVNAVSNGGETTSDMSEIWHVLYVDGLANEDTPGLPAYDESTAFYSSCSGFCTQIFGGPSVNCASRQAALNFFDRGFNIFKNAGVIFGAGKVLTAGAVAARFTVGIEVSVAAAATSLVFYGEVAMLTSRCPH